MKLKRFLKYTLGLMTIALICDGIYLAIIWPNWHDLKHKPAPKSRFIENYESLQKSTKGLPKLKWYPTQGKPFSKDYVKPFIIAEDSRFYSHPGIDIQALAEAMRYNMERGRIALGASTISQQTIKNLFLSANRTPLRKWHELVLTLAMESQLSKSDIIALYLNIAEFGPGVFGIKAASLHYFGQNWQSLNLSQRIALAASLPSPRKHNPHTQTSSFLKRVNRISRILVKPEKPSPPEDDLAPDDAWWDLEENTWELSSESEDDEQAQSLEQGEALPQLDSAIESETIAEDDVKEEDLTNETALPDTPETQEVQIAEPMDAGTGDSSLNAEDDTNASE